MLGIKHYLADLHHLAYPRLKTHAIARIKEAVGCHWADIGWASQ